MRLRSFNAPTMQEAMALVKAELGPDAVILSTEAVGKAVKVTAALDRDAILANPTSDSDLEPLDETVADERLAGVARVDEQPFLEPRDGVRQRCDVQRHAADSCSGR